MCWIPFELVVSIVSMMALALGVLPSLASCIAKVWSLPVGTLRVVGMLTLTLAGNVFEGRLVGLVIRCIFRAFLLGFVVMSMAKVRVKLCEVPIRSVVGEVESWPTANVARLAKFGLLGRVIRIVKCLVLATRGLKSQWKLLLVLVINATWWANLLMCNRMVRSIALIGVLL